MIPTKRSTYVPTDSEQKWDVRFLELAATTASWSKDPSTKCGSVIVRPDRTICSTGYNGFPRNMKDNKEFYEDKTIKYSRVIHAEMNALLFAKENIEGFSLYVHPLCCCDRCSVHVIQTGIKRVVFPSLPEGNKRWLESVEQSIKYFTEAGVLFTEYDPSPKLE